MTINKTPIEGLLILQTENHEDNRGSFQKLFNHDFFAEHGLDTDFREFYYSVNHKDVVRGMHFQTPPADHVKLVYVSHGRIMDAVVDIRKGSATYGKCYSIELDAKQGKYLYIPKGLAHGFVSLEEGSIVNYAQTSCYDKEHDCGIDSMSVGVEWGVTHPTRSGRDLTFPALDKFESPF